MSIISPIHIAFFAVIALLALGPKRFPEFTKTIGQGIREFRGMLDGASPSSGPQPSAEGGEEAESVPPPPASAPPEPPPSL
jgi:Sec-independent protein translocase protein TatA